MGVEAGWRGGKERLEGSGGGTGRGGKVELDGVKEDLEGKEGLERGATGWRGAGGVG